MSACWLRRRGKEGRRGEKKKKDEKTGVEREERAPAKDGRINGKSSLGRTGSCSRESGKEKSCLLGGTGKLYERMGARALSSAVFLVESFSVRACLRNWAREVQHNKTTTIAATR